VAREVTAAAPGEKLVGAITYIRTGEGWPYLATVIDCYSKEVIGCATADPMRTELSGDAIAMAARNQALARDRIFHSDRGSRYASSEFAEKLVGLGLRQSLGRTGSCFDNALAGSFFGVLRNEGVHRTVSPAGRHAARDIARYIEIFYNRWRLHSGLGYRSPCEVRVEYLNRRLAA
jgi:transposase InsO family protein